ncbi:MAG: TonB-dependent receptor [Acidobacteriota bacterium]
MQKKYCFTAALIFLFLANVNFAQEQEPAPEPETEKATEDEEQEPVLVDTITVTGTKQDLTVQETVTSVSVYDSERIDREVVFELDDILRQTANVTTDGGTNNISIRGISRTGVGGGTGVTSNIFVDGAPLSGLGGNALETLWDVEQVEVLRGPQSTVQGRNSLSGAVVINSKRPTFQMENLFRLRFAELGTRQYSAAFGGPLSDSLAGRITANVQEYDGQLRYFSTNDFVHDNDSGNVRGQLLWLPQRGKGLSWRLLVERSETESRETTDRVVPPGQIGTPEFEAFDFFGDVGFQPPQFRDYDITRYVTELDAPVGGNFNLNVLGTFEDVESDTTFGNPDDPSQFPGVNSSRGASTAETITGEVRLEYGGEQLTGRLGGYYFEQETGGGTTVSFPLAPIVPVIPADSIGVFQSSNSALTENYAFFGEFRYEINEAWVIEAGFRYDNESSDLENNLSGRIEPNDCIVAPFVPFIGGVFCRAILELSDPEALDVEFDAWLPRASITYRFDDDRSLSFGVQEGYRAGGSYLFIDTTSGQGANTPQTLETFDPEFLTNYEIAFRSQWLDRKLTLNANAFYSDWRDQQIFIPGLFGIGDARTVNAGESELRGLELEARWRARPGFEFFSTLGYSETEFLDFPYAVDTELGVLNPDFADLNGNEFPTAPNFTGTIGAYYRHQKGYFGDVTISHTGESFSDITNTEVDINDAVTITNLRFGYERNQWRAFIYANNVFDERTFLFTNFAGVNRAGDAFIANPGVVTVNRPRLVGVAIDFSF